MKNPKPTKKVLSRRSFIRSVAAGAGALYLLGKVGNSLAAQDLEVFSEPKKAKDINEAIGMPTCGYMGCGGGGSGGQCSGILCSGKYL